MNYTIKPSWDTELAFIMTFGTIGPNSPLNGLVYYAYKETNGDPTAIAGKYAPGAIVAKVGGGVVRNSGTTASPAWTAM